MYRTKYFITTDKAVASYEKRLSICLRSNGFSFSLTTVHGLLLALGEADQEGSGSMTEVASWIKSYFAEIGIECFGLHECELIVDSAIFTWVPDELYTAGMERRYLEVLSTVPLSSSLYADHNAAMKAYMVFASSNPVIGAFRIAISGLKVRCQHSKLVNGQLLEEGRRRPLMLMHLSEGKVDVEAFDSNGLLLSNSYAYANHEELLYHGLEVMKKLNIETPIMELQLCGNADREVYALLRNYFPKVSLYTGRPLSFENAAFQTLHSYRYALLLS